jgi:hypothetical protein
MAPEQWGFPHERSRAMTRDDAKAIIVDALKRCATLGWTDRHDLQANLILRGLETAGVKMRVQRSKATNGQLSS